MPSNYGNSVFNGKLASTDSTSDSELANQAAKLKALQQLRDKQNIVNYMGAHQQGTMLPDASGAVADLNQQVQQAASQNPNNLNNWRQKEFQQVQNHLANGQAQQLAAPQQQPVEATANVPDETAMTTQEDPDETKAAIAKLAASYK